MAKQIKVREDNYFAVQGWMVTELKLKGNALMLYAIIYGFTAHLSSYYLFVEEGTIIFLDLPLHFPLETAHSFLPPFPLRCATRYPLFQSHTLYRVD